MTVAELTSKINKVVDDLDFATARVFLEENMDVLNGNKNGLNSNARELLKFISEMHKDGAQPLSRKDISIINTINSYARAFDVRGIKRILKDHPQLFIRPDITAYLNSDAKVILEGMGPNNKS